MGRARFATVVSTLWSRKLRWQCRILITKDLLENNTKSSLDLETKSKKWFIDAFTFARNTRATSITGMIMLRSFLAVGFFFATFFLLTQKVFIQTCVNEQNECAFCLTRCGSTKKPVCGFKKMTLDMWYRSMKAHFNIKYQRQKKKLCWHF